MSTTSSWRVSSEFLTPVKVRRVRVALIVVGLPAIALAAWYAYGDIRDLSAPPLWALLPAGVANIVSLWAGARSWSVLLEDVVPRRVLDDSFYTSQLMKYTPAGGVTQAFGQAVLARTDSSGL